MATNTNNLNLVKPDYSEGADIGVINGNMDIIDNAYMNLMIVNEESGNSITLQDATSNKIHALTVYGKATQGASPSPDYPQPIESKIVNRVDVLRKNLLNNTATSQTVNGVAFDVNDDKTIKTSGSKTGTSNVICKIGTFLAKAGIEYICSYLAPSDSEVADNYMQLHTTDFSILKNVTTTLTLSFEEDTVLNVRMIVNSTTGKTYYPMIRPSFFTDATYEPYQSQTVNLSAPIELNGIGGVRDTIEIYSDGTGKYIQRIGKVVANKNTRFNTVELSTLQRVSFTITNMLNLSGRNADVLSSHFVASIEGTIYSVFHAGTEIYLYVGVNNATDFNSFIADKEITFYYPIAKPIETALPQADIDAIKALHTYKPNTVVMNDADAEMEVQYVADTKTYIDNKFNELATALVAESEV